MTNIEFSNKLTSALKDYIKSRGYIDSGKLLQSVKFTVSDDLDIKLDAEEYINYLDGGKFLDKFFALDSTQNLIESFILQSVEKIIDETEF